MTATVAERLTLPQKLLRVAAHLPAPFHESDLTVSAWEDDQTAFGLKRREREHPDSNKVRTLLVGRRGLISCGWLVKVEPLTYDLTRRGRKEADKLADANGHAERAVLGRIVIPEDLDDYLVRLRDGTAEVREMRAAGTPVGWAFHRWLSKQEVSPAMALDWFGCGPGDRGEAVLAAAGRFELRLKAAEDYAGIPLSNGEEVSDDMLNRLRKCAAALLRLHARRLGV